MKIYLDVCCLNRPFDDQTQDRIRLESEAILAIIGRVEVESWKLFSSDAVAYEISNTPSEERQERLWSLESVATENLVLNDAILRQAEAFNTFGFTNLDALHLAFASSVDVDAFLSTDDKLLKRAQSSPEEIKITVANPLAWFQEFMT